MLIHSRAIRGRIQKCLFFCSGSDSGIRLTCSTAHYVMSNQVIDAGQHSVCTMEEEELCCPFSWSRHSISVIRSVHSIGAFICNYGNDVTVAERHFRPLRRTVVRFGLTRTLQLHWTSNCPERSLLSKT